MCSNCSFYENGLAGPSDTCAGEYLPTPKRHHPHGSSSHLLLQHGPGLLFSPGAGGAGAVASSHPHVPPSPHLHPAAEYSQQYGYASYPGPPHCNTRDSTADLLADRRHGDEEWKNIHVVSCMHFMLIGLQKWCAPRNLKFNLERYHMKLHIQEENIFLVELV